ncbi:hypothetical protein POTOM_001070 [Populus tomentosa]|uniref:BZIP domain-containing protein n=1 Tax=Populus tomentosa TaxID=118781 RepID=A0A8X8DH86_POPTO|nr:hypothetical protein POTOM_001070 [Populus tomentosa]
MNPDHFDNQEAVVEWGWERCIQEPTGDSSSLDAAKATPTVQLDNMTARTSTTSVPKTEDRRDKKKSNSKAYRDRCRENKKRQEDELKMQAVENARLKDENESLVKEKDTILRPKLELAANVASHDELKSLRDEVARLRENVNIEDPRMQEKKQIFEEHLSLSHLMSLNDGCLDFLKSEKVRVVTSSSGNAFEAAP